MRAFAPQLPPHAFLHYRDFDWACSKLDGLCEHLEERIYAERGMRLVDLARLYPFLIRHYLQDVEIRGPHEEDWRCLQKGGPLPSREKWLVQRGDCALQEANRCGPEVFLYSPSLQYRCLHVSFSITKRFREAYGKMPWDYSSTKGVVYKPIAAPVLVLKKVLDDLPDPLTIASCRAAASSYKSLQPLASLVYWARNEAMAFIDNALRGNPPVVLKRYKLSC